MRDATQRRSAGDLQAMLALDGAAVKVALDALRGANLVRSSEMEDALSYAAAEGIADDADAPSLELRPAVRSDHRVEVETGGGGELPCGGFARAVGG